MGIVEKFIKEGQLTREEYPELLHLYQDPDSVRLLREEAVRIQKKYFGNKIYTRGLIEFTNYCRNDCYYCGIRRSNKNVSRYRLTKEEILMCCENGHELGFRTFVLQGGEDPWFNDDRMVDIIQSIRQGYPDCAITLSIGEKSKRKVIRSFKEAGADRYLLRHETANEEHYRYLHPENLSSANRKQCLYDLKELGYQIGAGFMVGAPGQTMEYLADDLVFLKELNPHMVGIGPFYSPHDTKICRGTCGKCGSDTVSFVCHPDHASTGTSSGNHSTGDTGPQRQGKRFQAGANVVMPNLSPVKNRKQYELYDNKICTGEEAAECRGVSCQTCGVCRL